MINTRKFAELNNVETATIYRRLSATGSYWGITPEKAINGRLRWPEKMIHKKPPISKEAEEC